MGTRLELAALVLVTAGLLLLSPVPAGADGADGGAGASAAHKTNCTFESTITLQPGLSVIPSSGTFTSGGETGTVACDGPVRGIIPTGPGTLGVDGHYGTKDPDTCFAGEGDGRFHFTFPTATGQGKRSNVFTFSFSPIGLSRSGFTGDGFGGGFDEVRPEEGDCFVHPVTKILVKGHGTIDRQ
jgi:hypothetical protein